MIKTKPYNTRSLFFSKTLQNALMHISEYPLTIVEAPMGYGKTTAVREYLKNMKVLVLWQRIYDSSPDSFWRGFCQLFVDWNKDNADGLLVLGFPADAVSLQEAFRLLENISLPQGTILVIEDYHLVDCPVLNNFIEMLTENRIDNLKIIITARFITMNRLEEFKLKGLIFHIDKEILELNRKDISVYYKTCGILINDTDAEMLYDLTQGWISALYLLLLEYASTGSFTLVNDIYRLFGKSVYEPLKDNIKNFVLCLCQFDSFTKEQAEYMWEQDNAENILAELVRCNAFLEYEAGSKSYHMHPIFSGFLKEIFNLREKSFQTLLYHKAAEWYLKMSDYPMARSYFYLSGDFDKLLYTIEADTVIDYSSNDMELIHTYMEACPKKIRVAHPYALLRYALPLVIQNKSERFARVCKELSELISSDQGLEERIRNEYLGELELLLSFTVYNQLKKMYMHHKKAWELLKRPTSIYENKVHWTFGSASVLYLYYRESGKLSENVRDLKELLPVYNRLTNGHGCGCEFVMEAEWNFNKGNDQDAEILLYKALSIGKEKEEFTTIMCVQYLQMRLALLQGDYEKLRQVMLQMRQDMIGNKKYNYIHMVEICESSIYAWLSLPEHISEKLLQTNLQTIRLGFPAYGFFHIMAGRAMLVKQEYLKLIGTGDYYMKMASIFPNLLGQIYTLIYLSAANNKIFKHEEAMDKLKNALRIAMPDRLYMPFVENGDYISQMLEKLTNEEEFQEDIGVIIGLYKKYTRSKEKIVRENFSKEKPKLTKRELEIAQLAAEGLTNSQIGQQLFISENTVKMALKSIFSKLSINSRILLKQYLNYSKN